MDLKDIVAIAGVPGLQKIVGKTKTGLIVESLDTRKRFATSIQDKVSVLDDISMYTVDGDMRLAEVLVKLNERGDVPSGKDEVAAQRKFLVETINLDSERVYDSDIRKLLTWFHVLKTQLDFSALMKEEATEEAKTEEVAAPKVEAPKAPKTAAPKGGATPKANSKGAAGSKNTYRPKSV